jgi:hypothetical protein
MESKKKKNNKKKNFNNINNEGKITENVSNINNNEKVKYFLMIPLEKEDFVNTFNELCTKLDNEKPKNFDNNLLQKPQKLHLTLIVLDINENKEKTEQIINIINSLINEIKDIYVMNYILISKNLMFLIQLKNHMLFLPK